jgi:hypothetical protein
MVRRDAWPRLDLYSELGHGSTSGVSAGHHGRSDGAGQHRTTHAALSGTETVLVVEDQVEARSVICATLRRRGYTVIGRLTSRRDRRRDSRSP